jgi:uncharacterized protein
MSSQVSAERVPQHGRAASGGPSRARVSLWLIPRTRSLLLLGTFGVAVELIRLLAVNYVDLLWFGELGRRDVFWTTLRWKIAAQGVAGFGAASFVLLNFAVVERVMARRARSIELPAAISGIWSYRRIGYLVVAVGFGLAVNRYRTGPSWQALALWAHRQPFGETDPIFHRDVGFFVFSLPLYLEVTRWLLQTFVFAGACAIAAYALAGGVMVTRPFSIPRPIRAHLLVLAAGFLLVVAWRVRLEQFALLLPHGHRLIPGATFTDVRIRLPLLQLLMGLAIVAAGLCLYATVRTVPLRPLIAFGVVFAAAIAGAALVPSVVERFAVAPQQLSRERPYVVHAIASTRRAFELDRVSVRPIDGGHRLTRAEIAANTRTLENVPLWDDRVLRATMNELESIGSYYRFGKPSLDRYLVNGVPRVLTLAPRQLDLRRLPRLARGWANARFAYTHGYGLAAVAAAGIDAGRYPKFAQREFSSGDDNLLGLRQPRIYFGSQAGPEPDYLVVASGRGEVEQPTSGARPLTYHYDGSGGIELSSPLRRAAFAARFGDLRLLLSRTINDRSRIIFRRDARQRVHTLVPFLEWDTSPQTTVIDGRVTFLFHGYTSSRSYPYSAATRFGSREVNYVRQAAHAAVDAFDGRVELFAAKNPDPIMRAWEAAYPRLFRSAAEMPRAMREHLRYPGELFSAQLAVYESYHATDPDAFWAGVDTWLQPLQLAGPVEAAGEIHFPDPARLVDPDERRAATAAWEMPAHYLLARLPGEKTEHFVLTMPFTPRGRNNLVGYLAGWLDDEGHPRLTLLSLPRDRLTAGPAQATRRILSNAAVDSDLQLLNRESRDLGNAAVLRVILGAPRIVPLAGQLIQVQPAYVSAGGNGIPKLQLVTVYANGRVGFGSSARQALQRALRAGPS